VGECEVFFEAEEDSRLWQFVTRQFTQGAETAARRTKNEKSPVDCNV
jgi:hypothetical protein